jgi:hypothetical protein
LNILLLVVAVQEVHITEVAVALVDLEHQQD